MKRSGEEAEIKGNREKKEYKKHDKLKQHSKKTITVTVKKIYNLHSTLFHLP
jgi:hypothetical protein